jgi:hypothetical protein
MIFATTVLPFASTTQSEEGSSSFAFDRLCMQWTQAEPCRTRPSLPRSSRLPGMKHGTIVGCRMKADLPPAPWARDRFDSRQR